MSSSPFSLSSTDAYHIWRENKLENYPSSLDQCRIDLSGPDVSNELSHALIDTCSKTNFVYYSLPEASKGDKSFVRRLCRQLGLIQLDNNLCADEDAITSLQVKAAGRHAIYIPYTDKPLSWHTDGYYNTPEEQIRGVLLHCVHAASKGGANMILDHEMAYLQLRDENPDYIAALMADTAMTIPPNIEKGVEIRGSQTGPVFSIDSKGYLHMRFSARTRNIEWSNDDLTKQAVAFLNSLLSVNNPYVFSYSLRAGEGIISNNVLHCRTGFEDEGEQKRLLYRARYFDRVSSAG